MSFTYVIVYVVLLISSLQTTTILAQEKCGYMADLAIYTEQDPQLADQIAVNEALLLRHNIHSYRSLINIPVVIHIIYPASEDSISIADVHAQLEQLNLDFNYLNLKKIPETFSKDFASPNISFCLAWVDEDGNSTTGIEQKSSEIAFFGEQIESPGNRSIKHSFLDGFDAWNTNKYINIWVGELDSIGGTATYPETSPEGEDGIIIDYRYFGKNNKTLTHEMGHFLSLLHLWGTEENCNSDDGIVDTPNQSGPNYNCPTHPQISCESADMFMNYMDYTDDNCMAMFTSGQVSKMINCLALIRKELFTDISCNEILPNVFLRELKLVNRLDELIVFYPSFTQNKNIRYTIYNIAGVLIKSDKITNKNKTFIDIQSLAAGMYLIKFEYQDDVRAFKFLRH